MSTKCECFSQTWLTLLYLELSCLWSDEKSNILKFYRNIHIKQCFRCENHRKFSESFTNRFFENPTQESFISCMFLEFQMPEQRSFPLVPRNIRQFIEFWLEILWGWLENWQLELWFHNQQKGWTPHDMLLSSFPSASFQTWKHSLTFQMNISFVYRGWSVDIRTSRAYNSVCIIIPKTICEAFIVHRPLSLTFLMIICT